GDEVGTGNEEQERAGDGSDQGVDEHPPAMPPVIALELLAREGQRAVARKPIGVNEPRGLLLTDAPEQALLGDGFGELARDQAPEPPLSLCVGAIALGRLAFVDGAPEAGPEATEEGVFRFGAVVRGQPGFAVQRIPGRAGWNEENLHERAGCPTG